MRVTTLQFPEAPNKPGRRLAAENLDHMAASPETMDRLAQVLRTTLKLDEDVELSGDMPLVGGEFDLDSLDVLLLITNVEREFSIRIRDGTIDRSAFKTLAIFGDHIERLRSTV